MNHVHKQSTQGFTLIELMLAMTFISVLLLAIAMTIIQIGTIYNKGMTVKEINQSGRFIATDVSRTATAAPQLDLTTDMRTNAVGGRLCFASYTYIWNYQFAVELAKDGVPQTGLNVYDGSAKEVHLVKVPDPAKIYCALNGTGGYLYAGIRALDAPKVQELLPSGDSTIGVNRFEIPTATRITDPTTRQNLYTLLYTIGSGKTAAMTPDRSDCLPPGVAGSDLTYCSVQQFGLVLKTGNRV